MAESGLDIELATLSVLPLIVIVNSDFTNMRQCHETDGYGGGHASLTNS